MMSDLSQSRPTNGGDPSCPDHGASGCGIVYVATGVAYVEAAIASAASVRAQAGNAFLNIHIWTDLEGLCRESGVFDSIEILADPHRRSKVDCLGRTPFRRTLFLDADTRIIGGLADLFRLLDRFDIAMAHAHKRANTNSRRKWRRDLPAAFPQLNSGVMLYRRTDKVVAFLDAWRRAFHEAASPKDQVTLREMLWDSDLQIYVLPPEFNVRYRKYIDIWEEDEAAPAILHMREFIGRGQ